jgi:hypothetical protein
LISGRRKRGFLPAKKVFLSWWLSDVWFFIGYPQVLPEKSRQDQWLRFINNTPKNLWINMLKPGRKSVSV